MLSRSCDAPVAVLAVLKSGAAYAPLDASYPTERLAAMLADAASPLVLVDPATAGAAPGGARSCLSIGQLEADSAGLSHDDPPPRASAEDLAYVIFTSGSTGRPKGVAMPHGPLVNLLRWQIGQWRDRPPLRTMQFAPLSFDVSFQEMFSAWWTGATLVIPDEPVRKDPAALVEFLQEHRIQRAFLPVVALQMLAETIVRRGVAPPDLREVITAGEQLEITPAVRTMFGRLTGCTLVNQYGPSETHVVTQHVLSGPSESWPQFPPIGRPIDGVEIRLLDADGDVTEGDRRGEIHIGGAALARGYLNQPERTRERFLPDSGGRSPSGRLYKTGDQARRRPDGELEFLGRVDDQVKIRGYRVELDEIRGCLLGLPGVAQAAVVVDGVAAGEKRLIAAVVPDAGCDVTRRAVVDHLKKALPEYMIPAAVIVLSRLPVTANGKVDRRSILAAAGHEAVEPSGEPPAVESLDRADSVLFGRRPGRPSTAQELRMVRLWQGVLGRNGFGVHDALLDLGASSLQVARIAAGLEAIAGRAVSVAEVVNHPTIRALCDLVHHGPATKRSSPLVCLQSCGPRPPLFLVHPGGGNALCYLELSRELGDAQPVYAFQARGVDDDQPPVGDVAQMAADYLETLCDVQPAGPYALAGWSFGGIVAFEMARQLHAAGQKTSLVGVIDAGKLYGFQIMRTLFPNDEFGLFDLLRSPSAQQVASFQARTARAQLAPPEADEKLAERIYKIFLANANAILEYRPEPLAGRVDLFLGREPLGEGRRDPVGEWRELCQRVEVHHVPGNHLTLIHPPHVAGLAAALRARLV